MKLFVIAKTLEARGILRKLPGPAMKVTRPQIVARGLTNRCPNCGGKTLFKSGSFFEVNKTCSACGFVIERDGDEGFYLGSMSLNLFSS